MNRENLRFDIVSVIFFVWLMFLGQMYISYFANRPMLILTPFPPLTFIAVIVSSPVIFSMLWTYGMLRGVILPYVWNWRDNHPKTLSATDKLEERVEALNDLKQLYFRTLENILGSEDKTWEEVDVELQRQEALLC